MKKATLKQIAEQAGVSVTTVHRALNGKGGCSGEVGAQIRRIAQEQGYSLNWAASSLRKQPLQIAMIFPFRDNGGRFGLDQILDGYLEYRREMEDYNIVFQEFLLRSNDRKLDDYLDMEYPELERVLYQISMEQPVRYDGVIIYGLSVTRKAEALLNRIMGRGTQVVVLERILPSMEDVCTVKADTEMAGNMAAEIFSTQISGPGAVAIISQSIPGGDACAASCIRALQKDRPDLCCSELPLIMNVDQGEQIAAFLSGCRDLKGIYSTCGRHTYSLLNALKNMAWQGMTIIGTELFEESHQALQDRTLITVLDRRPQKIGYMAVHLLLNALGRGKNLPVRYQVPPRLIIRSNSDAHFVKREYQHELDAYSD